jgi:hypothetical protein
VLVMSFSTVSYLYLGVESVLLEQELRRRTLKINV